MISSRWRCRRPTSMSPRFQTEFRYRARESVRSWSPINSSACLGGWELFRKLAVQKIAKSVESAIVAETRRKIGIAGNESSRGITSFLERGSEGGFTRCHSDYFSSQCQRGPRRHDCWKRIICRGAGSDRIRKYKTFGRERVKKWRSWPPISQKAHVVSSQAIDS